MEQPAYLNGVFIIEVEGPFGPYLSIGITENGVKNILATVPNEKGVRNFAASRQKNDQTKFAIKAYSAKPKFQPTENEDNL